jgi:hypothetical protein
MLGVRGVYVNSSIVDEGARGKTSHLHVEGRIIPIYPNWGSLKPFPESNNLKTLITTFTPSQ